MRAYGSDRVRQEGAQWIILCPRAKNWQARTPRTMTSREHPGTAVLWDDSYFEVISASASGDSVRYVLAPWPDEHAMRLTDRYDAASEAQREADHSAALRRRRGRFATNLLGILAGHLPAPVQEHLGSDLGVFPTRLTLMSLILPLAVIAWVVLDFAQRALDKRPGNLLLTVLAAYLGAECAVRLQVVLSQSRPIGSAAGLIAYSIWYLLNPRRKQVIAPLETPRGFGTFKTEPPEDVALRDAYTMRIPLLTLLTPAEQNFLAQRFGFDYKTHARMVAGALLVFAVAGAVTSVITLRRGFNLITLSSLLLALAVAGEQVSRLAALRQGPAGSFLAVLVRTFSRKVLRD